MKQKESQQSYRINPTFTKSDYENIEKLAAQRGCKKSEIVRDLTLQGLNTAVTNDNLDFICKLIRQEIKHTQQPAFDRLASLNAKSCIMAATSAYLTAETIASFVPLEQQREVQEVYDAARRKALEYVKSKVNDVGE